MRVVFDTNIVVKLINGETSTFLNKIKSHISTGVLLPCLCESQFIQEILPKNSREAMRIGNPKWHHSENIENDAICLKLGSKNPIFSDNPYAKRELELAIDMGFKILQSPLYICDISNPDLDLYRDYYLNEKDIEKSWNDINSDRIHAMNKIEGRIGSINTSIRTVDSTNKSVSGDKKIDFSEVADRYIVAATYGYNINVLCSLDEASSKPRGGTHKLNRVFHPSHKGFLQNNLGISIVKPDELVKLI
jgi:predicted nucleic acid-binding protein